MSDLTEQQVQRLRDVWQRGEAPMELGDGALVRLGYLAEEQDWIGYHHVDITPAGMRLIEEAHS